MQARVVVLNGVSSVGKTTTAREIQRLAKAPFLHMAMDTFLDMLPPRVLNHADGWSFETQIQDGRPAIAIHSGILVTRMLAGMRRSVAAMASQGNNVVVDDVMFEPGEDEDYRAVMRGHDLKIVALHAPLEVIESRERARGDREIGLARWQYERVHLNRRYDLEFDTSAESAEACAARIVQAFDL
jgi:chloramphenicol 3-O phosphotransferase